MNSSNPEISLRPAFVISVIVSLLIGVAIACPTLDILSFLLIIIPTLVPIICVMWVTLQFMRRRSIVLSRLASVALGSIIGISTGFLSLSVFRLGFYLLS